MNREKRVRRAGPRPSREQLVAKIRERAEPILASLGHAPHRACLVWGGLTWWVLSEHGYDAYLQAGTASWRRVPDEQDDGVCPLYFSYVWEPGEPMTLLALLDGRMPEMHVWAGIQHHDPKRNEIVDLTVGYQPQQCMEMIGQDWQMPHPRPGDWFWGTCADLERNDWRYYPDLSAIKIAMEMLQVILKHERL